MINTQTVQDVITKIQNKEKISLNIGNILKDIFIVLNEREKNVITQRFNLNLKGRKTLEHIGQQYGVTRERIRQIEENSLLKLSRIIEKTDLKIINEIGQYILKENGNIMIEDLFISEILKNITNVEKIDGFIVKLALSIDKNIEKKHRSFSLHSFWYNKNFNLKNLTKISNNITLILKKNKDIIKEDILITQVIHKIRTSENESIDYNSIKSILHIDKSFKKVENEYWGLTSWRHINPKSLRHKAWVVLKKEKKPLHFVELANKIADYKFDNKIVRVPAVHNELIKHKEFVLIGRGLYALAEWGYKAGTVSDIIYSILKKANQPVPKQDIIKGVLKQRNVKLGTISLNLQDTNRFKRVGRAIYTLR